MKLSVKLRPTVEGRSSEISELLSPPLLSFEGRCFLGGELFCFSLFYFNVPTTADGSLNFDTVNARHGDEKFKT